MRTQIDVIAEFDADSEYPRPIRFKILENGIKKPVNVDEITNVARLGAGGRIRLEYTCRSAGQHGKINYKLLYLYQQNKWEIEI